MRELSREEVDMVSGGISGSVSISHQLGAIPALSIHFDGNHGAITIGGVVTPFGPGFPPIRLP